MWPTNDSAEINVSFCQPFWEAFLIQIDSPKRLRCRIIEEETSCIVGLENVNTEMSNSPSQEIPSLKRKSSPHDQTTYKGKQKKFEADLPQKIVRKDVHTALKDLNLMPQIGSDLACSMCPYISKRKGDLKVHYKLKHLGGADLIFDCAICSMKIKTKPSLKTHYKRVHSLADDAAKKLMP